MLKSHRFFTVKEKKKYFNHYTPSPSNYTSRKLILTFISDNVIQNISSWKKTTLTSSWAKYLHCIHFSGFSNLSVFNILRPTLYSVLIRIIRIGKQDGL